MRRRDDPVADLDRALSGVRALLGVALERGEVRPEQVRFLRQRLDQSMLCLEKIERATRAIGD